MKTDYTKRTLLVYFLDHLFLITSFLLSFCVSNAQVNVIMNHNNLIRTGWNSNETILTQSNISNGNFGLVFSRNVDDQIYAQPLVLSNVSIGGGIHNVVIVATVNNSLYAFDADNASVSTPYWKDNLTYDSVNYRPIKNTDMTGACGGNYEDFSGNIGIVGTPAIDTITNTLYVVSRSVTKTGTPTFVQYLHAIDISTGAEKPGSPVSITGTYTAPGHPMVTFDEQKQNQRPGLLLYNGIVYIGWASHCDWGPYEGWLMGYDISTLAQKYTYSTVLSGGLAGIWMSGQPPAVDDNGNIYITTGNGSTGYGGNPDDTSNRASSLIKLSTASGALKVADFFTPMDYEYLNDNDLDYGVDGVLLIPYSNLSLSGSKEGKLYLINDNDMGGATSDNSNVLQTINVSDDNVNNTRHLHGSPVYYKDRLGNEYVYAWPEGSLLKQLPFVRANMLFDTLNTIRGNTVLPNGMPGAMLSISSDGTNYGTGILWASHPINGDANQSVVPGDLQAFDVTNVTHELWNSNWSSKRDSVGNFAKFVPPTIANGKVYMATFSNKLNVYGLNPLPASPCSNTLPPLWQSSDIGYVAYPGDVCVNDGKYTITASGADIWGTEDAFHYVYQQVITDYTDLTARVVSIKNTNANAKCGIMFRQNLDPGSPYIFLALTPSNGIWMQQRNAQSASATTDASLSSYTTPYWVRVVSTGNKYVSYISPDGNNWAPMDSVTLALGTNPYVGFAYSTHDNTVLDTAIVDNVTLTIEDPLAVNLINFSVKNINEKYALLNWTTDTEINIDHFDIQHSSVNSDFNTIGTVKGNDNSSISNDYSFEDAEPLNGENYYRLKEVDSNRDTTYSSVVPVTFNFNRIEIFPNPADKQIYVRNNKNFSNSNNLEIQIIDFAGNVLYKQNSPSSGANIITVNVPSNITNGVYVVMVTNSKGEKQGAKIFINR
ncbi:MAG TPA: T9SS type A sorting domain-containing protein [Hanamia sp.]|nr:T9SS type A sorting domain-containing protein [Hanamia sp.]